RHRAVRHRRADPPPAAPRAVRWRAALRARGVPSLRRLGLPPERADAGAADGGRPAAVAIRRVAPSVGGAVPRRAGVARLPHPVALAGRESLLVALRAAVRPSRAGLAVLHLALPPRRRRAPTPGADRRRRRRGDRL